MTSLSTQPLDMDALERGMQTENIKDGITKDINAIRSGHESEEQIIEAWTRVQQKINSSGLSKADRDAYLHLADVAQAVRRHRLKKGQSQGQSPEA